MSVLKHIPFSLLELAAVPEQVSVSATLSSMLDYAQRADELGFNRFWLAEHHNMPGIASSATAVLIGQVAARTQNIRVGSGGIMLPNHPPLIVAEQFGTLDALYPGRIDLGLGRAPGSDPLTSRALKRDDMRAERFPEEVAELQQLLGPDSGRRVQAYPGTNSQVDIWLLGSSLFSAQLAAQRGIPYAFAGHFAPQLASEAIELYHRFFQPSEHLQEPYSILCLPMIVADSDEEARYLNTSSQQRVMRLVTGQPIFLPAPVETTEGLWDPAIKARVDAFLGLSVVGGPATVRSKLEAVQQRFPVNEFMFTNDIYDRQKRMHALELLQQVRNS